MESERLECRMMAHNDKVVLETERLILRQFELSDAEAMYLNWASDPEAVRFMCYNVCDTLDKTQKHIAQWLDFFSKLAPGSSWGLFAIELKVGGELIGTIDFHENDHEARTAEIGYQLGKAWWRKGYAAEALRRVIKYCFEVVGLNRLWADHNSLNTASGKVLLRAGMSQEGTFRQCYYRKGELVDKCSYAILADDYFGKSKAVISIVPYEQKYHDDMLYCFLSAKDAVGRYAPDIQWSKPALKEDLCDIKKNYLERGDVFLLAIDEHDRVAGMIGTQAISTTDMWLKRLFIKPESKGRGIGSKLLLAVEEYAIRKGIKTIHTRFANWYREAAVFYPAKGFVEAEKNDYLCHMIKQLE